MHSLSVLGESGSSLQRRILDERHYLSYLESGEGQSPVGERGLEPEIRTLQRAGLVEKTAWDQEVEVGINLRPSRRATARFEYHHRAFLNREKVSSQASPSTTLGNLSSWIAQDLQLQGPHFSHSITCATGLHAVANAISWLQAGLSERFIAEAAEAPLTPFILAQMRALRVYSKGKGPYPCQALNLQKSENSMVLGEGACLVALEPKPKQKSLAWLKGLGFATESIGHAASVSPTGEALFRSMKKTMGKLAVGEVDAIVTHAPGTLAGDRAEYRAIQRLFGNAIPFLANNKWKLGYSFAASGLFNLEMALAALHVQRLQQIPYLARQEEPEKLRYILVNALGFGDNAVSLLVSQA